MHDLTLPRPFQGENAGGKRLRLLSHPDILWGGDCWAHEEPLSSLQILESQGWPRGLQASGQHSLLGGRKIQHFPAERKTLGKGEDHEELGGIFCPNLIFKCNSWLKAVDWRGLFTLKKFFFCQRNCHLIRKSCEVSQVFLCVASPR